MVLEPQTERLVAEAPASPIIDTTLGIDSREGLKRDPKGFLLAFLLALVAIIVPPDVLHRLWLWDNPASPPVAIATIDRPQSSWAFTEPGNVRGPNLPNGDFAFRQYEGNGRFVRVSHVRINNLGWVSPFDYPLDKAPDEFRVAFLGDSMTASITNDIPWVAVAQRELQKAVGRPVLLMNFGNPGFSPSHMSEITLPIAERMKADLVITNLTIEGLAFVAPLPSAHRTRRSSGPTVIGDVLVSFYTEGSGLRQRRKLVPSIIVPLGRELSAEEMQMIVEETSRIARWKDVLAPRLLLLSPEQTPISQVMTGQSSELAEEEQQRKVIQALQDIRRAYPNALFTINPLAWYYNPVTLPPQMATFKVKARSAGLDIIDMRDRMPPPPENIDSAWYNLPHDGHWSDAGAELYGRAMARLILDHVPDLHPAQTGSPCAEARCGEVSPRPSPSRFAIQ